MEINGSLKSMANLPLLTRDNNNALKSQENSAIEPMDQFLSGGGNVDEIKPDSLTAVKSETVVQSKPNQQVFDGISGFPTKKWTILIYSAADNDLEKFMVRDAIEMEKVGVPSGANIVMQMDRGEEPSEVSGQWKGARRIEIRQDNNMEMLNSPVLADLGQINMSDPKNLQDFIEWGVQSYPAENYMIIFSDHGAAWRGALQDKSHKGWMSMPAMREAMEAASETTGVKMDIIGFDACLMANTEAAYELKDQARFMVASQDLEGAEGWPYHHILTTDVLRKVHTAMLMKSEMEPENLARLIVSSAAKDPENLPTMSAIDLHRMKEVGETSDLLAEAIIATKTPNRVLTDIIRRTQSFEGFKDHYDFARRISISEDIDDEILKDAAKGVMEAVHNAIVIEQHNPEVNPGANGLTVNVPSYKMTPPIEYLETAFARETRWDEALGRMDNPFMAQSFSSQHEVPFEESTYRPWEIVNEKNDTDPMK